MKNKTSIIIAGSFAAVVLIFLIIISLFKFDVISYSKTDKQDIEVDISSKILNSINELNKLDNFQMTTNFNYSTDESYTDLFPSSISLVSYYDLKNKLTKYIFSFQYPNKSYNTLSYQDFNTKIQYDYDDETSKWTKKEITEDLDVNIYKELVIQGKQYKKIGDNEYEVTLNKEEYLQLEKSYNDETISYTNDSLSDTATFKSIYQMNGNYISKIETISIDGNSTSGITILFSNYNGVGDVVIPEEAYGAQEK